MHHADIAGFPTFVREFGDGVDHAVMLHCALAHSKVWTPLAMLLSDRFTMVAPDMPGHGKSAVWDKRDDIHAQVTKTALECLGQSGHVIGHSFGATVALRVAMQVPDKVRTLTLIEPVLFAAAQNSVPKAFDTYRHSEKAFGTALAAGDFVTAAQAFTKVWGDSRPWDTLSERERTLFASQMPFIQETEGTLMQDSAELLRPGGLEAISCPTLLVRGENTNPVIAAIHSTLCARIKSAREVVVPEAGHMVPITHPQQVAVQIRGMLDTVSTSNPCNLDGAGPSTA